MNLSEILIPSPSKKVTLKRRVRHPRPWTNEETYALETAIDHGMQGDWVGILALHGRNGSKSKVLRHRSNIQLKDRARTLTEQRRRTGERRDSHVDNTPPVDRTLPVITTATTTSTRTQTDSHNFTTQCDVEYDGPIRGGTLRFQLHVCPLLEDWKRAYIHIRETDDFDIIDELPMPSRQHINRIKDVIYNTAWLLILHRNEHSLEVLLHKLVGYGMFLRGMLTYVNEQLALDGKVTGREFIPELVAVVKQAAQREGDMDWNFDRPRKGRERGVGVLDFNGIGSEE